ncbi:MAG: ribonuclease HI [Deltaproteobacteria bacterium]|nr:ribonuclease HI [Deltaproteobacteria bacterium]
MEKVTMYTDGSCLGNPGPGGYGTILDFEGHCEELSGGYRHTTNNRMEMMACIMGLEALDHQCNLTIVSDSKYLVDSVSLGWAKKWRDNGWRLSSGRRAENVDLWERLLDLLARHQVEFEWVKAHNGHLMNELCDQLATAAAHGSCLFEDEGYTGR